MSLIVTDGAGYLKSLKTTDDGDGVLTPHHNVDDLPGTVEADIGASRGFLQTLASAIVAGKQAVTLPGTAETDISASKSFLQTLASAVSGGRQSVALPGTSETDIGASRGFLQTLAACISANRAQVDVQSHPGTLVADIATLASAISSGSMKAVLQAGSNAIGKLSANAGVNIGTVDIAKPTAGPVTVVPASVSAVTLVAANTSRVGLVIVNNSTATLYVKFASGATTSSWSFPLQPGAIWEMPPRYHTDIVTGIWSAANGDAHVTETA